jgi:PhnB protein
MALINPRINFNGNAQEAFNFYQAAFGGEFQQVTYFKDLASEEFPIAPSEEHKLMRIALPIGPTMLIGNDIPEMMGKVSENENRSKIAVTASSRKEADALFTKLSQDGGVEVPFDDNAEGPAFAMFRDKFGIEWIIEYT